MRTWRHAWSTELKHPFPGTQHLRAVGLSRADALAVREYAKQHGFTLVSKDADLHQMSLVHGRTAQGGFGSVSETALPVMSYASSNTTTGGSLSCPNLSTGHAHALHACHPWDSPDRQVST